MSLCRDWFNSYLRPSHRTLHVSDTLQVTTSSIKNQALEHSSVESAITTVTVQITLTNPFHHHHLFANVAQTAAST